VGFSVSRGIWKVPVPAVFPAGAFRLDRWSAHAIAGHRGRRSRAPVLHRGRGQQHVVGDAVEL